ncbi:ATP-dependent helicase [Streptomyces europaeiscabiei]|uniref:ATP-dependent helicase n=1 Tax=Streptomyces europaeiscabiei TaxID=146819 RepID=UPI0029B2440B|nr:ATP-dependent helicase [Streptomyces europaeiscabiei]MDX3695975.1 ATP-dependent helicase [Streptomyces europaeiscabiei]
MSEIDLTEDQRALVDAADSLFAVACPGAGKTRAMVTRFLKRTTEEPRKGIGLISFTNAAVDEVRRRCGGDTESLKAPNFVGTFDSFLHRFIVTPLFTKHYKKPPRYVQSWKDAPTGTFRMYDNSQRRDLIPGSEPIQMGWFDFDQNGRATLVRVPTRFGKAATATLMSLRAQAEEKASNRFGQLIREGTVTCEAGRILACIWVRDPKARKVIAPLLKARFAEVIVDEAQDCGEEELLVLGFLRECGIGVIMVGDIDQSIYEFRSATPRAVQEFAADLPIQLVLRDNFRSSPAISAFNNGLRSGSLVEVSSGKHDALSTPVHLLEFSNLDEIAPAALRIAEKNKLDASDLMLLSHAEVHSMKAAGVTDAESAKSKVLEIADAGIKLRATEFDARTRLKTLEKVERSILKLLTNGTETGHKSFELIREELGIDSRWLREFVVRLSVSLNATQTTRTTFAAEARDFLNNSDWGSVKPPKAQDISNLYKAPSENAWSGVTDLKEGPAVPYATVHGVKGLEFRGVVLIIPEAPKSKATDEVLDAWERGLDTEARRVLYVAGSRAEELLMLAVHATHADRVAALLGAKSVPYERT